MRIEITDIAKKYHRSYLFKNVSLKFEQGKSYALLGPNGSGKSTLLKIISGFVSPTKGEVKWFDGDKVLELSEYHKHFSFTAPYLELFEDLTLEEQLSMHFKLKSIREGMSLDELIEKSLFTEHRQKQLKHFSSGMMQRLKLALALFDRSPILLLDEPCTNMDAKGVAWYRNIVQEMKSNKMVIVASNQKDEYDFCDETIVLDQI